MGNDLHFYLNMNWMGHPKLKGLLVDVRSMKRKTKKTKIVMAITAPPAMATTTSMTRKKNPMGRNNEVGGETAIRGGKRTIINRLPKIKTKSKSQTLILSTTSILLNTGISHTSILDGRQVQT